MPLSASSSAIAQASWSALPALAAGIVRPNRRPQRLVLLSSAVSPSASSPASPASSVTSALSSWPEGVEATVRRGREVPVEDCSSRVSMRASSSSPSSSTPRR
ncbi:hypothetical protein ACFFX0_05800 [Citricoccus parietis]|uniref:Uncharacterized protein n=1 Tax=Citricoccus parietis TaxID=592307 RepID=A0ABV5FVP7_9MICC